MTAAWLLPPALEATRPGLALAPVWACGVFAGEPYGSS